MKNKSLIIGCVTLALIVAISGSVIWLFSRGQSQPAAFVEQAVKPKIRGNRASMIFHLPNCPDYNRISQKNIVEFESSEDAEKAGYRMAKNCP